MSDKVYKKSLHVNPYGKKYILDYERVSVKEREVALYGAYLTAGTVVAAQHHEIIDETRP